MEEELVKKYFLDITSKNDIEISKEQIDKFYLYMRNLQEWNEKINLTAIKDEKNIIIKHFIDSIIIRKEIVGEKLIDIGSGAGMPGIPLKIINDNLKITLIDSINKKVNFMKNSIELLDLDRIEAIHTRAEDLAYNTEYREQFDTAISRAVANMNTLVEYMLPFVKVGGRCLCLKGDNCQEEIDKSQGAVRKLGGKIREVINYKVEDNERNLIIIDKIKTTEQTYPRKQGKALKEPLL